MKILATLCAAICLTVLVTYWATSTQQAARFDRERQLLKNSWDAERTELEAALKNAKQRRVGVTVSPATAADVAQAKSAAHEILDKLKKTKMQAGEQRSSSVRHIIHQLESLADLGPEALPAIQEFLNKFEDVDYSSEWRDDDRDLLRDADVKDRPERTLTPTAATGRSLPRLDTILPPSLRLGLVQVLRQMDNEQAEQVLVEMLSTSGRGVEVAYVAKALQEMVPNKYRDVAVTAAKDLLANPPAIDRPNRLDENAKNFLYGVLALYNDQSFATAAQSLLVTQDGRVDRTALTYLTGTLKEEAVPALYQAFKDTRVTNMWERASLATQILTYTGANPQANDIFKELVGNESLPSWLRATAIQTVAGGHGPLFGGNAPTDPAQIKARIDLLNSLPDIADERLARARAEAVQKLSDHLSTDHEEAGSGRSFRNRLGQSVEPPPLPPGRQE